MFQQTSVSSISTAGAGVWGRTASQQKRQAMIIIAVLIGLGLIFGFYVYHSAKLTVVYSNIIEMRSDYTQLVRENANTLSEIAISHNIRTMARQAQALGYQPVEPLNSLYVQIPETNTPDISLASP